MALNWTTICLQLQAEPVQRRLDNASIFGYLLVATFACLLLMSAFHLYKVFRQDSSGVWRLHKIFLGIGLVGSGIGIGTWICYKSAVRSAINALAAQTGPNMSDRIDAISYTSDNLLWTARYYVLYCLQFCSLSLSKLLVLDRLIVFFISSCSATLQRRIMIAVKLVLAAVSLGIFAMLSLSIVAAVKAGENSAAFAYAESLFRQQQLFPAIAATDKALLLTADFRRVQASIAWMEASLLLVMIAAIVAAGVMSLRRIDDAMSTTTSLQVGVEPVRMGFMYCICIYHMDATQNKSITNLACVCASLTPALSPAASGPKQSPFSSRLQRTRAKNTIPWPHSAQVCFGGQGFALHLC